MNVPRNGLLVALALAGGIAIGAAGSTIAANPSGSPSPSADPWTQMTQMMGDTGMMGSVAPGSSFGPGMMGAIGPGASFGPGMMNGVGMMGNLSSTDRDALLNQCDELHDAMHAAVIASPSASGAASPAPSGAPSLHDLHHPKP